MLRALILDETTLPEQARPPDAAEHEELAWLDGVRARLDDEPRQGPIGTGDGGRTGML